MPAWNQSLFWQILQPLKDWRYLYIFYMCFCEILFIQQFPIMTLLCSAGGNIFSDRLI